MAAQDDRAMTDQPNTASGRRTLHFQPAEKPTRTPVQKIPHQLESLIPKWTIKRLQKAWLFTCKTCGDEFECTCFPSGAITPKQFNHLRYHRHKGDGAKP
jgi:hypothetical protein